MHAAASESSSEVSGVLNPSPKGRSGCPSPPGQETAEMGPRLGLPLPGPPPASCYDGRGAQARLSLHRRYSSCCYCQTLDRRCDPRPSLCAASQYRIFGMRLLLPGPHSALGRLGYPLSHTEGLGGCLNSVSKQRPTFPASREPQGLAGMLDAAQPQSASQPDVSS